MRAVKIDLTQKTNEFEQLEEILENNGKISQKELISIFGYDPIEEVIDILEEDRLTEKDKKELLNAYSAKELTTKELKELFKEIL